MTTNDNYTDASMSQENPTLYNGRYEIQRRLARGGMADVFLARDRLLDRPVAIKVLFPDLAADESFVERFRREAQAAANLNHANIVSIYDWGQQDATYFIVMEYIKGKSLADQIREEGTIVPDRAAEIAQDVAAALAFAHKHGVIHRDVKPGNVMITEHGDVKVADFGIATVLTDTNTDLTRAGTVMGTATYFAPEQAQGKPVDARSDVYALGVVLYEMLVGAPPFKGDTPLAVAIKHVQEQPISPLARGAKIAESLDAITMKMLAKDPEKRYPSASDARSDLRRYLDGMHSIRRAATPSKGTPAATGATQVVTNVGATTVQPRVTQQAPRVAAPPPPPSRAGTIAAVAALLVLALGGLAFAFYRILNKDDGKSPTPTELAVPNLVGKSQADALAELRRSGFTASPDVVPETSDKPQGQVLDQDPKPGERAKAERVFVLKASAGQGLDFPPDVVGLTADEAQALIVSRGFVPQPVQQPSLDVDEGRVISQDPRPDTKLEKGKPIIIRVSSGGREINLPDFTGQAADSVLRELGRLNLKATQDREASETIDADRVIRTEPAAGKIKEGQTVKVIISDGPPKITIPNLRNQTREQADAALRQLGLVPVFEEVETFNAGDVGKVVSQDPVAGSQLRKGAQVRINIGKAPVTTTTSASTTSTTRPPTTTVPGTTR